MVALLRGGALVTAASVPQLAALAQRYHATECRELLRDPRSAAVLYALDGREVEAHVLVRADGTTAVMGELVRDVPAPSTRCDRCGGEYDDEEAGDVLCTSCRDDS